MITHVDMTRSVRAECRQRYADARQNHRRCAEEYAALKAVTSQELRQYVRAKQPGIIARAASRLGLRAQP